MAKKINKIAQIFIKITQPIITRPLSLSTSFNAIYQNPAIQEINALHTQKENWGQTLANDYRLSAQFLTINISYAVAPIMPGGTQPNVNRNSIRQNMCHSHTGIPLFWGMRMNDASVIKQLQVKQIQCNVLWKNVLLFMHNSFLNKYLKFLNQQFYYVSPWQFQPHRRSYFYICGLKSNWFPYVLFSDA